jgi:serine O-acetyltransferase
MIRSRADYLAYLEADRVANGWADARPPWVLIQQPIWYFLRLLRRAEYQANCAQSPLSLPLRLWVKWRLKSARLLLGFNIPLNTTGPGLRLVHEGDILIHQNARIGHHACINIGVVIGIGRQEEDVPWIGDHVIIEPGAKIFGGVKIADWTHIGANAVVNRSIDQPGQVIAGVPARPVGGNPRYLG